MAKIRPELIKKIGDRLGISRSQVYNRIQKKVQQTSLPLEAAAVALAAENGVNVSKYRDELAVIRSGTTPGIQTSVLQYVPEQHSAKSSAKKKPAKNRIANTSKNRDARSNSVFVVHGRNIPLKTSMYAFLRAIGLTPLEWGQALQHTKKTNPYVGEVLEAAFHKAIAVVVILSPDDFAKLQKEFLKPGDQHWERVGMGQARPNVLFEAGMAMGKSPDSTVLVQIGEVRPFSDIGGRHGINLNNSAESRQELARRLKRAGCDVNTDGADWMSIGDFELTTPKAKRKRRKA